MSLFSIRDWFRAKRFAGLVLLYHRVAPVALDPQLMCVQPDLFDQHMAALRRHATVMPLEELLRAAEEKRPRRAVAVTFDDGYADNLHCALPILERHAVPATLFACSGAILRQEEYWWDTAERALLGTRGSATVELQVNGSLRRWDLEGSPENHPAWNVLSPEDPTPRHKAYREIVPLIKALLPARRTAVLQDLLQQLRLPKEPGESHRPLTSAELRIIASGSLVQVGAHTVTHAQLSALPAAEQAEQIGRSKSELEAAIGRQVPSFAYPYGSQADYTMETVELVRRAGFQQACSNFPGVVETGVDRMQVPRMLVRNVACAALEAQISKHFGDG